jgi:hypothetical protein
MTRGGDSTLRRALVYSVLAVLAFPVAAVAVNSPALRQADSAGTQSDPHVLGRVTDAVGLPQRLVVFNDVADRTNLEVVCVGVRGKASNEGDFCAPRAGRGRFEPFVSVRCKRPEATYVFGLTGRAVASLRFWLSSSRKPSRAFLADIPRRFAAGERRAFLASSAGARNITKIEARNSNGRLIFRKRLRMQPPPDC